MQGGRVSAGREVAVFAGGCFWAAQELLRHHEGVVSTRVGYTGGANDHPTDEDHPGHAEAVEVVFDPDRTSYRDLVERFLRIHRPDLGERQVGSDYRSEIFCANDEQRRVAEETIAAVDASGIWPGTLVTRVSRAGAFWESGAKDQDYFRRYAAGPPTRHSPPLASVPFHQAPGAGLSVENPAGGRLTFKATADDTGGAMTVVEGSAAPGEGPPLHVHRDQDETIYVLQGRYRVRLAGRDIDASSGAFVFIPRRTPHTWQNAGDEIARFVATLAPADPRFERFFVRYSQLAPDERGVEAFERLACETRAMDVVGPPLAGAASTR